MKPIRVPKTPPSSFNKDRRPSKLLLDQIEHLEWAVLPAWQRKPNLLAKYRKNSVKTEQQAAERIAQLTEMVLKASEEGAQPVAGERPTATLPRVARGKKRANRAAKIRKVGRTRTVAKTQRAQKTAKAKRAKNKAARGRR